MNKLLLLLVLTILSSSVHTQETFAATSIIEPPALTIGDTFFYSGYRSLPDAEKGRNRLWSSPRSVTEIDGSGNTVFMVSSSPDNVQTLNREGNLLESRRPGTVTQRYSPSREEHKYPLAVGKEYKVKSAYNPRDPDNNRQTYECSGTARNIGWEAVTVPAGTFRAFKIEVSGWCNISPSRWVFRYETIKWLAPEVRMMPVLYSITMRWDGDNGGTEDIYSLSAYTLK